MAEEREAVLAEGVSNTISSPGTQSSSVPVASCRITPSSPRGTAPRPSACASTRHTHL